VTSADDILHAIDHAVHDFAVSSDAMRWTPEPGDADDPDDVRRRDVAAWQIDRAQQMIRAHRQRDWTMRQLSTPVRQREQPLIDPFDWVRDEPPMISEEQWDAAANPPLPPCQDVSLAGRSRRGASPQFVIVDEIGTYIGSAFKRLAVSLRELVPAAHAAARSVAALNRAAEQADRLADLSMIEDPDRPGRRTEYRRGRQAQVSPYGPQPRKARR